MNKRTRSLAYSLVGSSIEFSFKKKVANVTTIEDNIKVARKRITKEVSEALSIGGEICVMLLAELTNFYRNEIYYMAVRGCIEMRRHRPAVLDYLQLSVDERAERLVKVLSKPLRGDKGRDAKIYALKYFLQCYPRRTRDFKKLLTKEEYMIVS